MASGYGINMSDWVIVAALGIAGYFAYQAVIKPVSDVTGAIAAPVVGISNDIVAIEDFPKELWQTLSKDFNQFIAGWNS